MLEEIWQRRAELVERQLERELPPEGALSPKLNEAMRYSLLGGGKRLRPCLLMAAVDSVGKNGDDFVTAACALEMIHTYSLIHDDLPAMDNDDYRRGKLTNHKVYGEGMAVLAGDALLTLAFEVVLRQNHANHAALLTVTKEFAVAAGMNGMVGGQAMDVLSENTSLDLDTLRQMHTAKTGALFRAAIRAGALLGGAHPSALLSLTRYAENFGLAFQITDDILDVTGEAENLGKPVGSDERNRKATYVSLTSLDEARKLAKEAVEEAKDALANFGSRAEFLREMADYLLTRNK